MPPKKSGANGVSEYESQRQANIAKNQALLKELQLNAASAGLAPSGSKSKSAPSSRTKPKPKRETRVKQESTPIPTRSSSRLKGVVADSEVAKRKAEEEREERLEQDRIKRMRFSEDIKLGDAVVAGELKHWDMSGNWLKNVGPARPNERTFDAEASVKQTSAKELKELRERMGGLGLWEEVDPSKIKITPERIYCMGFHPTTEKPLVFAGDKLGNLGCFDGSQKLEMIKAEKSDEDEDEEEEEYLSNPEIMAFKVHTRTISAIHFTPSKPQSVYTCSYDSSIRSLDITKGISTEVYGPADRDVDDPLSGIQIPTSEPHMLYFTTLNGAFGMHDTRMDASKSSTQTFALSEKKIGGFSVHPVYPHLLATASLDRTMKLWDLRKITGKAVQRMPALLAESQARLSVSHASFNAMGQIATSSYDDYIRVHSLPSDHGKWSPGHTLSEEELEPSALIPHNNQTGRWVTILRPQWQARPEASATGQTSKSIVQKFAIGNMNRFVDVYAGTGEQIAQLGGDGITAVPAVAVFHDSQDWVAGGTSSGKLTLWI